MSVREVLEGFAFPPPAMLGGKLHNYRAAPQANSFPPKVGYQTVKNATITVT